ncbi:MAG: flagellar hook-basal body complex protein FliE [Acetobacteraceae bacterium]|nr:flagellar hook-basal body complex protein FliE [Acetobacteraceae bacterium]
MTLPRVNIAPSAAAQAYAQVSRGDAGQQASGSGSFASALQRAAQDVVQAGHDGEQKAAAALAGGGDLTQVVTAVSQAELALQATMAIRDRVVQAYQDIMKMPI